MIITKIVVLVVTLFTYNDEGGISAATRHQFVQENMQACAEVQKETMAEYYQQPPAGVKSGILTMCRYMEPSHVDPTDGSKLPH